MSRRHIITTGLLSALVLMTCAPGAAETVSFTATSVGGGLFQYDITINNTGGPEPAQGLILFDASTNFGLGLNSVIGAPQGVGGNPGANWDFFAPDPPFTPQLTYFSTDPAADIPINSSLSGFTFQSFRDPSTVGASDFQIDLVGSLTSTDIPTVFVPEPSSWVLLTLGAIGLILPTCKCRLTRRPRR